jgi:hypothetical protein
VANGQRCQRQRDRARSGAEKPASPNGDADRSYCVLGDDDLVLSETNRPVSLDINAVHSGPVCKSERKSSQPRRLPR